MSQGIAPPDHEHEFHSGCFGGPRYCIDCGMPEDMSEFIFYFG